MLKSLWAGVSGMQAHQVGLDVTSNNIANVNTTGFKSSRANFADMIYQPRRGATTPQGGLGGLNAFTIGLGGSVNSTTRVHEQGSLKSTNWKGDLALSGQGFFIVSGDGGRTRALTRDGQFGFDAQGNFLNNAGYIVQGWTKDISSFGKTCAINENQVDTSGPISGIRIDPKMVMPARMTDSVKIAASLTSSDYTDNVACSYALDSSGHTIANDNNRIYDSKGNRTQVPDDMGTLFSSDGNAMKLQHGQGIWVSYRDTELTAGINQAYITSATATVTQSITLNGQKISFVNNSTSTNVTSVEAAIKAINNYTDKTGIRAYASGSTGIQLINDNSIDGDSSTKNIRIGAVIPADGVFSFFKDVTMLDSFGAKELPNGDIVRETAFNYKYTTQSNLQMTSTQGRVFNSTEDLRRWMQYDANIQKNSHAVSMAAAAGGLFPITISNYSIAPGQTGAAGTLSPWGQGTATNPQESSAWTRLNSVSVTMNEWGQFVMQNNQDGLLDEDITQVPNPGQLPGPNSANNLKINIANYQSKKVPSNVLFGKMMGGLNTSALTEAGPVSSTGSFKVPKLTTSFDIFDSLGNKHTLTVEFRKKDDLEWTFSLKLPEPAEFTPPNPDMPNVLEGGSITFNRNGGLQSVQPNKFIFNPRSGATSPQEVDIDFGQNGVNSDYKGVTSTNEESAARNHDQNGWASGTLTDWSFDANGILIGEFNNGKNFALAKVAIGTVANESGLNSWGNNLFGVSPNSGDIVVGEANKAGNANIEPSKREQSTADLSEELTQLIVIQRGYQANSKTVTTSDQILNTLLQLKQ
ncbi:flagellar hook protein FlgE [Helicobacter monodelphidis]|uniref:flagellar hook protein FlgE n=1 Tax=Helicobacter sp. 15-1451 TaxID=2004995 RepID=UPI000DCD8B4F|nr:flagellar hook protein FlgE [Helicobacter sp. 15-1451]RAX58621.1 flagellar hook protein FlgE [Helicobacter sp. 15-1451]